MEPSPRPPSPLQPARLALWSVLALLALLAGGIAWSGCTVTEKNYKYLSFFFDGVPDPRAIAVSGTTAVNIEDLRRSPTYSGHPPYLEDKCDACHGTRFRLTRNSSRVCKQCHEEVASRYPRMHGPVAAGACLWCHTPHESAHANLLRDAPRTVCAQCHSPDMLDSTRVPEHADESRSCLECHFGHGGPDPFFLREAAADARPRE